MLGHATGKALSDFASAGCLMLDVSPLGEQYALEQQVGLVEISF